MHIDLNKMRGFKPSVYNFMQSYGTSKVLVVMMSRELSKRLLNTTVRTYCIDPGFVHTDLFRENPGYLLSLPGISSVYRLASDVGNRVLFRSPVEGCKPIIYAAVNRDTEKETGLYYGTGGFRKEPSDLAKDANLARALWKFSCEASNMTEFSDRDLL